MLINISRKNSIYLGLSIVVIFFSVGILMLMRSNSSLAKKSANVDNPENVQPEAKLDLTAPITMSRFERHQIKDGKKLWEIIADKGKYTPLSNTAELEQSKLFFYRKDDSVIQLISNNSKVIFSGTELKGAELYGGVELIYNEKVKIQAESAQYDKTEDRIYVPGEVTIQSENVDLSGKNLLAYVSKHEVSIGQDVETTIKPKKK